MGARLMCATLLGIEGVALEVTAVTEPGLPGLEQRGLSGLGERAERVWSAVTGSGLPWPRHKTTVTVSPALLPLHDTAIDLAMAVAVLAADETVPEPAVAGTMFYAGLAPSGSLVPLPGAFQAAAEAAKSGCRALVVAARNAAEARLAAPGMVVIGASRLGEVAGWLRDGDLPAPVPAASARPGRAGDLDLGGLAGDRAAYLAAEVSAAGGHHLAITGPPGSGAALLARRVHSLLPPLDAGTALEVTAVYSAAGLIDPADPLVTVAPFLVPPHSASLAEMTCGWESGLVKPGAASLAHRGVLYLDEAPHFDAEFLDALRRPAGAGTVSLPRAGRRRDTWRLPARFTLVTASAPCPCLALRPEPVPCTCSAAARSRYAARLSGPLSDRISLRAALGTQPPLSYEPGEPVAAGAARVAAARKRTAARLAGTPWQVNAEVPADEVTSRLMPPARDFEPIRLAMDAGLLNGYAATDTLRVAWTLADLNGRPAPAYRDCAAALELRIGQSR
jgi:magnesium chelatase family protein